MTSQHAPVHAPERKIGALTGWFFLFSCNLMWALQFTCIKLVEDQVGPFFTVWAPMAIATLMLYPLLRRQEALRLHRKDALLFLTLAAFGVFPGQFFVTWGTRLSLASNAALLMLALPVCTAVMARFFLGERMTRVRWASFAAAIIGVLLCSGINLQALDFSASFLAGNVLIFAGLNGSAFYNSYGKKVLERYSPMAMLFWTYVAMMVILTPTTLATEWSVFSRITAFTGQTWTGLILLTFFHNFLSMVLFLRALHSLDATQAALSNYLITFFGLPISAIWLGEQLTPVMIAGGIAVLISTLAITLWDRPEKYAEPV